MKLIDGAVIRDLDWPGCIGDSMRETSQLHCMLRKLKEKNIQFKEPDLLKAIDLSQFRTPSGYVRHEDAPAEGLQIAPGIYQNHGQSVIVKDDWREKDTSGDQYILWYREIPFVPNGEMLRDEMRTRVVKNFLRYGNNNLIHPGFFAELANWKWAIKQNCNSQVDLFESKYRWNDGEGNTFQENEDSSADYWVWSAIACEQEEWLRKRVGKKRLMEKFVHYLKDEPDSGWFLEICDVFADVYF